jgi:2-phosphosulfolactate phosphatase
MKIDLSFNATQFDELQLRDKNIVILDVLRASTTIIMALNNGAREIIPVASIESAVKISGSLFGEVTLRGGERNGKMIKGFNLGNSPLEYNETAVKGKSIIYCTTNGSVAMSKSRYARTLAIGAFVNLSTIVDYIQEENKDFLFICAGRMNSVGHFSVEDAVCAGMIIQKLLKNESQKIELSDSAKAANALYKTFGRSIIRMLRTSEHGKYLNEIGFGEDLKVCAAIDTIPVIPMLSGTVIKLRNKDIKSQSA